MIQTWLLYHNALSTDVVVSDILRYARRTQESGSGGENTEDLTEQINELKKVVQRQEVALTNAGLLFSNDPTTPIMAAHPGGVSTPDPMGGRRGGGGLSSSTPAAGYMRAAVSMSGMDLWGDMALGDVRTDELQNSESLPPSMTQVPHISHGGFSFTQPDTMPPR
jgi:callose synthase